MKKAWMAGLSCLLLGGVLFTVGLAGGGGETFAAMGGKTIKNTHTVSENFKNISVEVASSDVRIAPAVDGTCKVVCQESENVRHTVWVGNDCLMVSVQDNRVWYNRIGFGFVNMGITVYLPQTEYGKLAVAASSGDIQIEGGFTFVDVSLDNASGEIEVEQVCVDGLKVESTSGSISLSEITVEKEAVVEATSGKIELSDSVVAQDVTVENTSGKIQMENVECNGLTVRSTSGRVEMADVVAAGETEIKTVSGGVVLASCDAESYFIKTTSGSVRASFRTAKQFSCKTNSGNITAPHSTVGGVCRVETSSGNIHLSISE